MATEPVRSTTIVAAPKDYSIPNAQQIRLLSVTADFIDNGAAGDWLPAVVVLDNNGNALCRAVDQGVKVTAGADAEVSWFPGVKPAPAAQGTLVVNEAFLFLTRNRAGSGNTNQTISSGAVTAIQWKGITWHGGTLPGTIVQPSVNATTLTWQVNGPNMVTLTVTWPAAAYDRYIELTITNPVFAGVIASPRLRTSATPDGDVMTLSAVIDGDPGPPATTLTANVFQNSGVDRAINAEMTLDAVRTPSEFV